jgi:ComF family protein
MRAWIDAALSILFAPTCAACARPLAHPMAGAVCRACWQSILPLTPPLCSCCGDPLPSWRVIGLPTERCARCRRRPRQIERACAIGAYDGALRTIIHAFKYDGRRSLAAPLAALMRARGEHILSAADSVVPVPLHPTRRRARGFNQSDDLARHLGKPVLRCLRRIRHTAVQAELPAARRHANVRHAFRLARAQEPLDGRVLVLIDDVSTTGATLEACAAILKEHGAGAVLALTAARVLTTPR